MRPLDGSPASGARLPARTSDSSVAPSSGEYVGGCSLTITRSTASPFIFQYSWARSSCRTMPWSSTWSIRTSTIGRSPEMPCPQSAEGPRRLRARVSSGRAQRGIGIEDARRQPLEEVRLVGRDPEVAQLDLRLRPREARHALERRRVAVLGGEREDGAPAMSATTVARCTRTVAPGARRTRRRRLKIGIEHRAGGVRQRTPLRDRDRIPDVASRVRESAPGPSRTGRCRPISPSTVITWAAQTGCSRSRGRRPATSASSAGTNSVCTKRFEKAGCAASAAGGREDDLGVRRHLDLARPRSAVRQRHLADLGVVLRRDDDLQGRRDRPVACDGSRRGPPSRRPRRSRARRRPAGIPPTRPCPTSRRPERRRCPSGRGSRPRATASRRRPRQRL